MYKRKVFPVLNCENPKGAAQLLQNVKKKIARLLELIKISLILSLVLSFGAQ